MFFVYTKLFDPSWSSTFLPQDRVAEFARMTPQTLLKETQRAAGNENLTTWHDALIESGQELKGLEVVREYLWSSCSSYASQRIASDKEKLTTLENRNATLEKEVKRFEERQALENKARFSSFLSP